MDTYSVCSRIKMFVVDKGNDLVVLGIALQDFVVVGSFIPLF